MTYFHPESGKYVSLGNPFSVTGIQYPSNWLELVSPEDIAAAGFVPVVTEETVPAEYRFYSRSEELIGARRVVTWTPFPAEQVESINAADVAVKLSEVREVREAMLNRMTGIALVAQVTGDIVTVEGFKIARQALLDITKDCPSDPALVDAFIASKYAAIVSALPVSLVKAFAGVDA
ncbi:hypothetical protein [Rhodoferax aquaticus]|uniref:Uncharacterized protein n=1 Tax=Rhodoferax aquaticus TaxID=2527691 RepID=A0A515ERQ2_9BURK|nr:hypothetical protein [Rhodoferax aquaticus]QDL55293.1 hypothetical protein EXZ61_14580 [Rhodoferax aquaticus]